MGELKGLGALSMAETIDGSMWFGTEEGLHRYDGRTWVRYGLQEGLIGTRATALCASPSSGFYVGTGRGIAPFKQGSWKRLFPVRGNLPCELRKLLCQPRALQMGPNSNEDLVLLKRFGDIV